MVFIVSLLIWQITFTNLIVEPSLLLWDEDYLIMLDDLFDMYLD